MNPIRFWKKFTRNYRDYGWQALVKSGKALLSPVLERNVYRIYVLDPRSPHIPPPEPRDDVELMVLTPDQDALIQQVEQSAEWLQGRVGDRLAVGDLCVAAVHGQTLAGFNLVTFGDAYIPLLKMTRRFPAGTAWSDHIAVSPAFRRGGIARTLRLRMFAELSARGVRKLYGGALRSNTASLRLAQSLGFRNLADVTYCKLGPRKSWNYRRCPAADVNSRDVEMAITRTR